MLLNLGKMGIHQRYGGFSPASLSGLSLWLDASDESTITESGGAVSQWDDKSGNGHHATSTGAARPVTGSRTENGLNVLDLDGSNHFLDLPSALYGISADDNTVIIAYATDNPALADQRILSGTTTGTRWGLRQLPAPSMQGVNNSSFVPVELDIGSDTDVHTTWFKRRESSLTVGYNAQSAVESDAVDVTLTQIQLGKYPLNSSGYLDGVLCEVLVYDRALTVIFCWVVYSSKYSIKRSYGVILPMPVCGFTVL